jgi:hypothetical protein
MMLICEKEGLKVNEATMHALVEGSNGDLRLILGQLQVRGRGGGLPDGRQGDRGWARGVLTAEYVLVKN